MMWDPSVYRGNTTKPYVTPEIERCNKKRRELDQSVKRRKFPRKQKMIGGIMRPSLSLIEETGEKIGFGDMGMQTEEFLQELTTDVAKKDMCTQVEVDVNVRRKEEKGCILRPFMIGTCQITQTDSRLTFPFEENVQPIKQHLSKKIMEQSLLETTEELELEAIRKEKRKYIELRCEELYKLKRAAEAQRAVAEERQAAMLATEMENNVEQDAEARLGAALFSARCMGGLLPITMGYLTVEGYTPKTGASEIYDNLLPWMDEATKKEYAERRIVSRKLLDEMLYNVTTEREAEYGSSQIWSSLLNSVPSYTQKSLSISDNDLYDQRNSSFSTSGKSKGKSIYSKKSMNKSMHFIHNNTYREVPGEE